MRPASTLGALTQPQQASHRRTGRMGRRCVQRRLRMAASSLRSSRRVPTPAGGQRAYGPSALVRSQSPGTCGPRSPHPHGLRAHVKIAAALIHGSHRIGQDLAEPSRADITEARARSPTLIATWYTIARSDRASPTPSLPSADLARRPRTPRPEPGQPTRYRGSPSGRRLSPRGASLGSDSKEVALSRLASVEDDAVPRARERPSRPGRHVEVDHVDLDQVFADSNLQDVAGSAPKASTH